MMLSLNWWIVIWTCVVAVIFDVTQRRIPNWLSGPVLLAGLLWAGITAGWSGLGEHALSCVILALPYVLLYAFAGGGAGDAKLMGAVGAWLGFKTGVIVLLAVAVSGIVLGIIFTLYRRQAGSVLAHMKQIIVSLLLILNRQGNREDARLLLPLEERMLTMPYGLAILAGVCVAAGGKIVCLL